MRALLLSLLAVGTVLIATPAAVSPASAQLGIETPVGGVRVGPQRDRRDYERRRARSYGYGHRDRDRGCSTTIVRRSNGTTTRIRRC
jgi:hypothetical protein